MLGKLNTAIHRKINTAILQYLGYKVLQYQDTKYLRNWLALHHQPVVMYFFATVEHSSVDVVLYSRLQL